MAPAPSSSKAAIHGKGEKLLGASSGRAAGAGVVKPGAGAAAALSAGRIESARLGLGSVAALGSGWLERDCATERVATGRSSDEVAGAATRGAGSRAVSTGGCAAGWRSAGRVTVPLMLKLDSSRGPILPAAAGGGSLSAALSCAGSGAAASNSPAAIAERQIKPLYLLAKFESPSPPLASLWPALPAASSAWAR